MKGARVYVIESIQHNGDKALAVHGDAAEALEHARSVIQPDDEQFDAPVYYTAYGGEKPADPVAALATGPAGRDLWISHAVAITPYLIQ